MTLFLLTALVGGALVLAVAKLLDLRIELKNEEGEVVWRL